MKELKLDIKADPDDKELIQFQAQVFNKVLVHYEQLVADSNHQWAWRDVIFGAEAILKAKYAYEMWRMSEGVERHRWVAAMVKAVTILLKELRSR